MHVALGGSVLELAVDTPELLDDEVPAELEGVAELPGMVELALELLDAAPVALELPGAIEVAPELLDAVLLSELPLEPPVPGGVELPPPHAPFSAQRAPKAAAAIRCEVILSSQSSRSCDACKRMLS
jgi:hypothetical protein